MYWISLKNKAGEDTRLYLSNYFNTFWETLRGNSLYTNLIANRGTVLEMLGRGEEAQEHFAEAEEFSRQSVASVSDGKPEVLVPSSQSGALTKRPASEVVFPDKRLEAVVREARKKREGALTKKALGTLETLEALGCSIKDVTGLAGLTGLLLLRLDGNSGGWGLGLWGREGVNADYDP